MVWLDFMAPHVGLALASSLSAWQQAIMLYRQLGKDDIYKLNAAFGLFLTKAAPAIAVLALVIYFMGAINWEALNAAGRLTHLLAIMICSAAAYAVTLLVCGIRPKQLLNP